MKRSLEFIDRLMEVEKLRDEEWKKMQLQNNKGSRILGDSIMLFHLKELRKLVEEESAEQKNTLVNTGENTITINGKTMLTSFGAVPTYTGVPVIYNQMISD